MATATIEPATPEADQLVVRPPEIIDGEHQEKLMGAVEVDIMSTIGIVLGHFAMTHQLGKVEMEMVFDFGQPGRPRLKPDVAFISHQRWPKGRRIPMENAFRVVPDLVVEVVSPSNSANEVEGKVMEYLQAGVRLIWVVHPTTARVYVHDGSATIKVVSRGGELDGGDVLPDFRLSMAYLFEAETEGT